MLLTVVVKLAIVKLFCLTWRGMRRHACVFTPGNWITGDVPSMKLNMTLTSSRWSSSDYYMTRNNHVGNVLCRNYSNSDLKAVEEWVRTKKLYKKEKTKQ